MTYVIRSINSADTERVGELLGKLLKTKTFIDLHSDLGGGKTTFVRGLARGIGSPDRVSSPTFTLKNIYKAAILQIHHFDFYRLEDPGVMADQLAESLEDSKVITVVEWSAVVKHVLPEERIGVEFNPAADNPDERIITFSVPPTGVNLIEKLRNDLAESRP